METKDYKEIIRFLEEELMDFYKQAKQNPNPEFFEILKWMLSGIAKSETILAMRGEGSYSNRGNSYGDGDMSYRMADSYRREGGQSERRGYRREGGGQSNDGGSYGNGSYYENSYGGNSYHGEDMTEYLRKRVRSEQDDRRRGAFEEMLRMMER